MSTYVVLVWFGVNLLVYSSLKINTPAPVWFIFPAVHKKKNMRDNCFCKSTLVPLRVLFLNKHNVGENVSVTCIMFKAHCVTFPASFKRIGFYQTVDNECFTGINYLLWSGSNKSPPPFNQFNNLNYIYKKKQANRQTNWCKMVFNVIEHFFCFHIFQCFVFGGFFCSVTVHHSVLIL